ncbi:hypothetical protein SAMN05421821_110182 [Mucilaginibacter lappiensis]|uniref:DUF5723 domain-containing protein n=1 Tax=Mucilaginibacter lappiensis TaxID=354630 RepID=A0ABR6PNJ5_9SPHI|nr:DUF5723 family protein [Mucilaginibacter lappiensis]MBB6111163.1 hypothetical protein [Mucilaginibacter lappiensis]SIR70577.1 hypothetical protein SAMN05421821_110182 [Mucilaginibacter lappiensis]
MNKNKLLIVFGILFFSLSASAQQFSQYNTGTLYDSFENPSQRSFIPDSSRQYAFNFLIPNFNVNTYLTGNAQRTFKSKLFGSNSQYYTDNLQIGQGKYNHFNANINAYAIMFKLFSSFNGDVEIGFSAQTKAEARGLFSDESFALLNGTRNFPNDNYTNIFNDNYRYQAYHQISFSYRERVNKKIAVGFKISALLGIEYQEFNINHSQVTFDRTNPNNPSALLGLTGRYYANYIPGQRDARDYLPNLRNPGAAISFGLSYITDDRVTIQGNIKDLGFIHWSNRSATYDFNNSGMINNLGSQHFADTLYNRVRTIMQDNNNKTVKPLTTATNGLAELSATKSYWIGYGNTWKYSPTLIASKALFYPDFKGALVNHFNYRGLFTATLTTSYDDMHFFNIGTQLMIKSPNTEFYIGTERLTNTSKLAAAALHNNSQINQVGNYSGGDFYLGFTLKFGRVIEHPMNASIIPMGEKGFFGRLFGRLFKTSTNKGV